MAISQTAKSEPSLQDRAEEILQSVVRIPGVHVSSVTIRRGTYSRRAIVTLRGRYFETVGQQEEYDAMRERMEARRNRR